VSRTIADLVESESITPEHVSEAVQYRIFDRTHGVWFVAFLARRFIEAVRSGHCLRELPAH